MATGSPHGPRLRPSNKPDLTCSDLRVRLTLSSLLRFKLVPDHIPIWLRHHHRLACPTSRRKKPPSSRAAGAGPLPARPGESAALSRPAAARRVASRPPQATRQRKGAARVRRASGGPRAPGRPGDTNLNGPAPCAAGPRRFSEAAALDSAGLRAAAVPASGPSQTRLVRSLSPQPVRKR